MNRLLVAYGQDKKIEKGKQTRIDCTVVSSNIHEPTYSSLLWDSVRVITRMLAKVKKQFKDLNITYTDHTRRAKKRMLGVMNSKNEVIRKKHYQDLLKISHNVVGYEQNAIALLENTASISPGSFDSAQNWIDELRGSIIF